jgi:hypothetical protein
MATAAPVSVEGFNCTANRTYPCQAYALYRAGFTGVPLDLVAVDDLFAVSRARQQPLHDGRAGQRAAAARAAPVRLPLLVPKLVHADAVPDRPRGHLLDRLHHQATEPHAVPGRGACEPHAGVHRPRRWHHGHVPVFCQCPVVAD